MGLKVYGFPTQNNGCGHYRVWMPLAAVAEAGLAEVDRDPDDPQSISVDRAAAIFDWADVVYTQPFSQLWAACIFAAARDEKGKKMVVDLDDNVWAVHPLNVGPVGGQLTALKSHFTGQFADFWELQPIKKAQIPKFRDRIDGTLVQNEKSELFFLKNTACDVKLAVEFMLKAADAVTTTNETLAAVIRQHTTKPVYVIPNCLDPRQWKKAEKAVGKWLGWAGSVSHYPDLQRLLRPLDRLMRKYSDLNVQIMGSSFDYLFPLKPGAHKLPVAGYGPEDGMFYADLVHCGERWPGRMRFDKPVPIQGYHDWITTNWQAHIGIAPIEANDFNDAKSELKWLEYTALGVPTVASDFGPYRRAIRDMETGLLGRCDWESPLAHLIDNPSFAQRLVDNATDELHEKFDIRKRAKDWMNVFEEVAAAVLAAT